MPQKPHSEKTISRDVASAVMKHQSLPKVGQVMILSGYGVLVDIILGIRGWISPSHLRPTIFLLSR
jgi:hypothetical protein